MFSLTDSTEKAHTIFVLTNAARSIK